MKSCTIEGCEKLIRFPADGICQMHYFRRRRTGSFGLTPREPRQERRTNFKGYVMLYRPDHPLRMKDGWIYEHRAIVYAEYGLALPPCELCGSPTFWTTCHIDHRDEVIDNNVMSNLRPTCRGCNTSRTIAKDVPRFEYCGAKMTLTQLARIPGVTVGRHQIKARMDKLGMTLEQAMFTKSATRPAKS